jgi:mRNA interferase MazF
LIVQADSVNHSRLPTVIGLVLTSNVALAGFPGNVLLTAEETGLPRDSVVNITQIVTVDKREQLVSFVSKLPEEVMAAVDWNLMVQLELSGYVEKN